MRAKIEEICAAVGGRILAGQGWQVAQGVSIDSRQVRPGELFFALPGQKHDGHDFVPLALAAGAAGAVVARAPAELPATGRAVVLVPDATRALQDLAAWWRRQRDIPVIGVTGSAGKTGTKDLVAAALASRWPVLKNSGNFNNELGMPLTLLGLQEEHRAVVLEMGMRGRGQITRLCVIARPTAGVITNIGTAHYELLGTQENIALAKGELLQALPAEGLAVLNGDDPWCRRLAENTRAGVHFYGLGEGNEFTASAVQLAEESSSFTAHLAGVTTAVRLPLTGRHNVLNALAALAVACLLGCSPAAAAEALAAIPGGDMRLQWMAGPRGSRLLNDTYNANPASVQAALEVLAAAPARRRLAVLGEMRELGTLAAEEHHRMGQQAARAGVDWLVALGRWAPETAAGARDSGLPPERIVSPAGREEALTLLRGLLEAGDVALIKASRGMALEELVRGLAE